jgi:hypothetical protein
VSVIDAEALPQERKTQMSARDRRRFLLALAALSLLLFAGGMVAYIFEFRHQAVCPGGKQWLAQSRDDLGAVTYICPGGLTVTQGIIP